MNIRDYEGPDLRLEPRDYEQALQCQDACNLSGIVHTFSKVMSKIWDEARARNQGTEWVNQHPIAVMYATQVASLSGASTLDTNYFAIDEFCRLRCGLEIHHFMKENIHES